MVGSVHFYSLLSWLALVPAREEMGLGSLRFDGEERQREAENCSLGKTRPMGLGLTQGQVVDFGTFHHTS